LVEVLKRLSRVRQLKAGSTLRVEIEISGGGRHEGAKQLVEQEDETRRQSLYFPDGETPGAYELRATFTGGVRRHEEVKDCVWNAASLTSPPVSVELEK